MGDADTLKKENTQDVHAHRCPRLQFTVHRIRQVHRREQLSKVETQVLQQGKHKRHQD